MAGRIPQSFINDLVERVDIVDVIDARVKLKKVGKNYQALCPFHEEKTASFNVNSERGFYKCFGCGVSGTALTFLIEHDRLEFVDAVEALAKIAGVEVPREGGGRPLKKPDTALFDLLARADKLYRRALKSHEQSARAIGYLKSRGLTGVVAQQFRIGYAPPGWDFVKNTLGGSPDKLVEAGLLIKNDSGRTYDRFRDRIMFPIRDTKGRVVGFGGRALPSDDDAGPKYLNSPETPVFHKSYELYGLFEARHALQRIERLIVVEGYMDVVALAQHAINNAVATLGTSVGKTHFEKLYRNTAEVVCCFDGDQAGRQAAWRALEASLPTLRDGRQLKFIFLPEGEDPDSLVRGEGKARFDQFVEDAKPAGEYLISRLSERLDLTTVDGQAQLGHLAMPLVRQIPDGIYHRMLVERLAKIAQVSPATLEGREPVRPARVRATAPASDSGLGRRLLGHLMRQPALFGKLDDALGAELLNEPGDDSLFVRVARQVAKDPATEPSTLLARFVREPAHEELRSLADGVSPLDEIAVTTEFIEGVGRYVDARSKADRRELVRTLKEDGSKENLNRYWQAKQENS